MLLLSAAAAPARAGLVERLERGETVTVVAFGDSLAAGFELANPGQDSYPNVFRTLLQRRYPQARIRLVGAGIPGDPSNGGAARVERDVLRCDPDLVTIQFGGNDQGQGRAPEAYRRSLEEIIAKLRAGSSARLILATPPIISIFDDTPMVKTAREVAKEEGLPLADFDAAIRRYGTGPRGPFPYRRHPDVHLNAVMAGALYQAFTQLIGRPDRIHVSIDPVVAEQPNDTPLAVNVRVWGAGKEPFHVFLECNGERRELELRPGKSGGGIATFKLPAPRDLLHTERRRLLAWARRGKDFAYDLRWLMTAPAVPLSGGAGVLNGSCLALGATEWLGLDDLSGGFRVSREGDLARFAFTVRDDWVMRGATPPNPWDSDCVELFLDLRPPQTQARPYWEPDVIELFLYPGTEAHPDASWSSMEALPEGWQPARVTGRPLAGGYELEADIPLALLRRRLAPGQHSIGFDVAFDDADTRWGRKSQMVWAGTADDFLYPSLYGALLLDPPADGKPVMRVVIR